MMFSPQIRRFLALLAPDRGSWTLVGGLMVASALGEVAAPYFTGRVTDRVTQEDATAAVWPLVLVRLSSAITELACDSMAALALTRARKRLQCGAVAAVLRGDMPGPGGSLGDTPGAVAERVTGDAEVVHSSLAHLLVSWLWELTRAVSLLATVAWLSPVLGLLTLLALPLFLLLPRTVGRIQQDLARQVRVAEANTTAVALESLGAIGTVRAFGHEAGVTMRVQQRLAQQHQLEKKEALAYAAGCWASGFPSLALKVAVLVLGGYLVSAGTVTPGELVAILMCQLHFIRAVENVLRYLPFLAKAFGSSETLLELLEQARKVTPGAGPPSPVTPDNHETTWTPGLCLKDVWMSYPGRSEPVLKGVSLSLRPGEVVAVLAPPGGGKSSLVAAALGLHPLAGGAVLLDGNPVTPRPHSHPCVTGVPQCPSLLSRSLSANITLGWEHKEETQVVAAARRVGVHTWAKQLPQGYNTEVGPRGMQLSGGQTQGVALARALLRTPRVLVLDEPTRALDPVIRRQVEQELLCSGGAGAGEGPAVLLVTGRVALAQKAPRVALLDGGRLRELGSPEELRTLPWAAAGDAGNGEGDD
uniref:TAP1 n=1 Tax=Catharus ustulatus TaxID=91951 RepID=A0A8C3UHF7_CATUS